MALIGWITVIECHHHDIDGHAFFLTLNDTEMTPGFGHGDCHTHQEPGNRHDTDRCAMHLSEVSSPRTVSFNFTPDALPLFVAVSCNIDMECPATEITGNSFFISYDDALPQRSAEVTALRAPPVA